MKNSKQSTEEKNKEENTKKNTSGSNMTIVPLRELLNDLADADAASVEINIKISNMEYLYLKVSIGNMQEGREILEQVDVVSHGGQEFDLDYDVTGYAPSGEFGSYLAVYQSADGLNYESVSVDAGLQKFENSLSRL